jgi:hypothetical protein
MAQEIARQLAERAARRRVERRDPLAEDHGVEGLAADQEGLQRGDTNGAAQIADDVEQRRGRGGVLVLDA